MPSEKTNLLIDTIVDVSDYIWRIIIINPILSYQAWRCSRAKAYLLRHDHNYRAEHIGNEIISQRRKLYEAGVSPLDSSLPDRWTMEDELPPMAWPQKPSRL